jgi:hypothetical protein
MAGIVAGLMILSLVYIAGVTLALFKEHGFRLKETFYDVVEAIQEIKLFKSKQGTRGS